MAVAAGPSVQSLAELRAAALALKHVDKEVRRSMNAAVRDTLNPIWRESLASRASTNLQQAVLVKNGRVAAGNPPRLIAAASKRPAFKGSTLIPDRYGRSFEFGTKDQGKKTTYARKNRSGGGTHQVTRRTRAQLPAFRAQGRVIFPAVAETVPRMTSLWAGIILRKVYDAMEGK